MSEFFDALEKGKHLGEIIANNISPDSTFETLEKGKSANIGEIRDWSGKRYKKLANGKWSEVSEHGMTKKEHSDKANKTPVGDSAGGRLNHELDSAGLSDKEHSDEEVGLGNKPQKGDKIEHNGVTIHVGKDTSGGQDTLTYKAPSVSDKTFWNLDKLKELIDKEK